MKISKKDLDWAANENIISHQQSDNLWSAFLERYKDRPAFSYSHVFLYFGALIVIFAMAWFITDAWEKVGGVGISAIGLVYAAIFSIGGYILYFKKRLIIPGGLLFTIAVAMTPLVVYGIEKATGLWPGDFIGRSASFDDWFSFKISLIIMQSATIVMALVVIRFVRFPLIITPIIICLWRLTIDLSNIIIGKDNFKFDDEKIISVIFGLVIIILTYFIDRRTEKDFAFWGYLFGTMAFWGGLSLLESDSEFNKFIYCMINVAMMLFSVLLNRKVFIVFGAIGVFIYLSHLADKVFEDSLLFPLVLSLIGIAIIGLGLVYQKNQTAIESSIKDKLPDSMKNLLPESRINNNIEEGE